MGSEFKSVFAQYLKDKKVVQFFRHPPFKAAVCERFNRTLKTRLEKYFTHNGTSKWIDVLDKAVKAYNNSFHRTIKMSPAKASLPENKQTILEIQKKRMVNKKVVTKLQIGDYVRITRYKGTFEKGYSTSWTEEIFKIHKIDKRDYPIMYEIESLDGEVIKGKFYIQELQKVEKPEKFAIQKIIKKKNGKYLVRFLGYKKPELISTPINKINSM